MENIKIISGNSHNSLATEICNFLNIKLCDCILEKFSNGELRVEIKENIRNKDIFIIQTGASNFSINYSINDLLLETLIMIDACKRSMVNSITLIMPCYPYARQDKKNESRAPISAKLVANLLERSGIDRMVVMDLHAQQIQGFFDIPVDNIYSVKLVIDYLDRTIFNNLSSQYKHDNFIVVSPDAGGIKRTLKFAKHMELPSIFIHKQRNYDIKNTIDTMMIVGDKEKLKGKTALICDDIADTAGTLIKCCDLLKKNGVENIICVITHGLCTGPALQRINDCKNITKLIVSNSVPQHINKKRCSKIYSYSISELMASVIQRIISGESISELF